ncbi:hypothetical protein [Paraburkholderia tropica]|nr:hypothetical protein [Paraburkholderia tropica]
MPTTQQRITQNGLRPLKVVEHRIEQTRTLQHATLDASPVLRRDEQ